MSDETYSAENGLHVVTIKHDAESHKYDCHDDCTADLTCPGVTDSCRCWWECDTCREAKNGMDDDAWDEYDDNLYKEGAAHGVEHQRIDGMWMTPTDRCLMTDLDTDAHDLIYTLPDGDHPVDLDCEESFVCVIPITRVLPPGHRQFTDASGTWCHKDCPQPDEECGRLAVEQNDAPIPPATPPTEKGGDQ